jgi:hypothetical protein
VSEKRGYEGIRGMEWVRVMNVERCERLPGRWEEYIFSDAAVSWDGRSRCRTWMNLFLAFWILSSHQTIEIVFGSSKCATSP